MTNEIIANRYRIEKNLGSGLCGVAYLTTDLRSKGEEKLKVIKKIYVGSLMMEETVSAAHEGNVLKNLKHENILKFFDSFLDKEFYCIVTEFCDEGDLDVLIQSHREAEKRFPEELVVNWLVEILLAVQYIHLRNILHRDIKTKNIFLKNNQAKLGDFGISKLLANPVDMAETFVGTPFYMSPEVLRHEGYNSKSDMWSVGCILYDLVALEHPFRGTSLLEVVQSITSGPLPQWPHEYSMGLNQVFLRLTKRNQSQRLSASEALALPFLSSHIQEKMNSTVRERQEFLNTMTVIRKDKTNLERNVQRRVKLSELQREAEEVRLRGLVPRDRMRMMRMKRADAEAQKLKNFMAEYHREVQAQYMEIRNSQNPYVSRVKLGFENDQNICEEGELSPKLVRRPYSASSTIINDSRHLDTTLTKTGVCSGSGTGASFSEPKRVDCSPERIPRPRTTAFDEIPITPMRDLSLYEFGDETLRFDDGIPENPELAETYYSQFDDFVRDESDLESVSFSSSEEEEADLKSNTKRMGQAP